jgi:sigma-B regulation protein RsbU (phosphoserine phosphatase)
LEESLTLAQQVQQRLLPHAPPEFPGFNVTGKSIYCDQTGGDYFDYLVLPEENGRLSVVVGDVAGHGIASALLMATARALFRMRVSKSGTPADIVSDMNRFLSRDLQGSGQFMSLYYLVLDSINKAMTWVRAGHDPALHYIPSRDWFEPMLGEGLVLGVRDDWQYNQYQTDMV